MAQQDVSDLLFDGETVEREVRFGTTRIVVTSHRLLAFTPDVDGANFRKTDRPNVQNVSVGTDSNRRHLVRAVALVVLAVPFLAGGRMLDFDGMFSGLDIGRGASAIGVGTGMIETLGYVFGLIDDALLWSGIACLVLVVPFALLYIRSRTTTLRIHVAGEDDLTVPVGNEPDVDAAADDLRRALGFEPRGAADPDGAPSGSNDFEPVDDEVIGAPNPPGDPDASETSVPGEEGAVTGTSTAGDGGDAHADVENLEEET